MRTRDGAGNRGDGTIINTGGDISVSSTLYSGTMTVELTLDNFAVVGGIFNVTMTTGGYESPGQVNIAY